MAERDTLPDEDLAAWPDDGHGDPWDGWDDDFTVRPTPPPPGPPWYRSPRLLLTLIGLAAAVLVVAAALLVTSSFSGEIPDRPALDTRIPSSAAPVPEMTGPPISDEVTPTSTPTSSAEPSPPAEPATDVVEEPAPSAAGPAAPSSRPRNAEGPRINVTRTPMSFTPGSR